MSKTKKGVLGTRSALEFFDEHVMSPASASLGQIKERTDVKSSIGSFLVMPDYQISYPEPVVKALGALYDDYNRSFIPLLEKNREWDTDYRYCIYSGLPLNFGVQIDMVGLPESFLRSAVDMSQAEIKKILRRRIFEIENSLAMYQLLEKCCENGSDSFFRRHFRMVLGKMRKRFGGKKIALLAVTDQKYEAMLTSEFGKESGEDISDEEVRILSGFDRFFGPVSFQEYLASNNGKCDYLLYVRSSDPVAKLKNPAKEVEHPLLGDPKMRRIIKAQAITFNVDAPDMDYSRRINDTKEYQPRIGMAFPIQVEEDLFSLGFSTHLYIGKPYGEYPGEKLSPEFAAYLREQEINPADVEEGKVALRCKPIKCAYGCYGHVSGFLSEQKFRGELRRNMRQRGAYVVQPEMVMPEITNSDDGVTYAFIDRNFMANINGQSCFIGGFRSLMPVGCHELNKGRNHGSQTTVWAEIVA